MTALYRLLGAGVIASYQLLGAGVTATNQLVEANVTTSYRLLGVGMKANFRVKFEEFRILWFRQELRKYKQYYAMDENDRFPIRIFCKTEIEDEWHLRTMLDNKQILGSGCKLFKE